MTEREKVQKAFIQCSDAISVLDHNSILKVFHLLSINFDILPHTAETASQFNHHNDVKKISVQTIQQETTDIEDEKQTTINQRKVSTKKTKASNSKTPTYLSDYDFRPTGLESLKDFYNKYKPTSNMENNLIFIYYLYEVLKQENINQNHIYSCYRHLGIKIPQFPSTLTDTKRFKGWIDTSDGNDIKITRAGINYIEHDLAKNNGD